MSWCDKLASIPAAGLFLDSHFASSSAISDSFSPLLDRLAGSGDGEKPRFNVDQSQGFNFAYTTENGHQTSIEPSKVAVGFVHRMRATPISGGAPRLDLLSEVEPYTKLLSKMLERLGEATLLLPGPKSRMVNKVGIVSATNVDEEEAPPGIRRFIEYVSRPWPRRSESYSFSFTSEVDSSQGWVDTCIHTFNRSDAKDSLLNMSFDWQRKFTTGRPRTEDSLHTILRDAEKSALEYFEELAVGNRFDVELGTNS